MRAKHIYNKNAREKALLEEAYSQVNEGHSGPVPGWEKQAGLEKELEANRKAARREPLEPSWDAEWEDALADILTDLTNTWQEGEWGDADKESLKEYINKFIDQKLGDGKIDDDASRPEPNPIHGGRPIRVRGQTMVPKLGRAAALRKEPGTDKDKLFYK